MRPSGLLHVYLVSDSGQALTSILGPRLKESTPNEYQAALHEATYRLYSQNSIIHIRADIKQLKQAAILADEITVLHVLANCRSYISQTVRCMS